MRRLMAALTVSLCVPSPWGQEPRATLQGTVQDSGGGVLPGTQLNLYPLPANVPGVVTPDGGNNYLADRMDPSIRSGASCVHAHP